MNKISLKNILTITKKELTTYFNNPTAYIALIVFLFLWEFLFFQSVFLVGEASLRILFSYLPWLFLFFIPAITMGSICQEKNEGTIEFLLTHPLKDIEFLLGKFFGGLIFAAVSLFFIFPIAASISFFGNLDWGVIFGQYLASFLMAATFVALGILISSIFTSQISVLLISLAIIFFYIIIGLEFITSSLPGFLVPIFERLSILSHFESMSRGVIDLRDLWYFISAIAIFISLSYLLLIKRRFGNRRALYRNYQIGIILLIGIVIVSNIISSHIPGRIDLTQDKIYTLTQATQKTLKELKDIVNVSLFASNELPVQLQPVLRETKDILRDYQLLSNGNVAVFYKDASDPKVAQEALSLGVRQVQFNVVGQGEFQLKNGFLGIAVSYAGKNQSIPFIQKTDDLEYQLTSFIKKLTTKEKKRVAFLEGYGQKSIFNDYRRLFDELNKQFEVEQLTIDEKNPSISSNISAIIIAGPSKKISDKTRAAIKEYLSNGGAALFLIDAVSIDLQSLYSSLNKESFADFLKDYGIEISEDLIYDLRSNESVRFSAGGGFLSYILPYPFWPRVLSLDQTSPITNKISTLVLPWASPLNINDEKIKELGFNVSRLFSTSKFGGKIKAGAFIGPDVKLPQENLGQYTVAASIESKELKTNNKKMRLIAVGDSDFLSDQFEQNNPENIAFALSALSWLTQEESIASISIKQKIERKLFFENNSQIALIKYSNLVLALVLPAGFGFWRLWRRKKISQLSYH